MLIQPDLSQSERMLKTQGLCLFMKSACAVRVELHSQKPTGDLPVELNRGTLISPCFVISNMVIADFQSRLFSL